MKPKMSCVNNCNSEVIWKTNPIQIVHLISFESRVVRQEMIACTSGNITSQIQTCIAHLSAPVLIVPIKMPAKVTMTTQRDLTFFAHALVKLHDA